MGPFDQLLGESPAIVAVRRQLERLLRSHADARRLPPILIQGETGTGKGLLAKAIHRASPRRDGAFVDVNCAAIPEPLLEAEMFGFERGAFTDARQAKAGLIQSAHRGTIFLDEVGLMPAALQAKLLKAIEEQTVRRLGSTRNESVDVWILAATSEDLAAAARERRFREDLYHRLAVLTVHLPPLRDRPHDVLLLAEHFLAGACADYRLPPKSLDQGARAALAACPWSGNVRELRNVMERVALLVDAPVVTAAMLELPASRTFEPAGDRSPLRDELGDVERERLLEALRETNGNLSYAAARLGLSRSTLRYRLQKFGLRPRARTPPPSPGPAAEPSTPVEEGPRYRGMRWDQRRLAVLRVVLAPASSDQALAAWRGGEVADKVRVFGGRIDERSPTGLVAVFGLEPVEDAPQRAAHAAIAIQKAAERAGGDALPVKAALHVGRFQVAFEGDAATIDMDAKREAWAVLDSLVATAEAGAVIVSEAAAPFIERRFELASVPPREPMGQSAYRVLGHQGPGFAAGRRIATFVGRHHDVEALRRHLAAALRGQGHAVGIVGEAGLGKSRLIAEFRARVAGEPVTFVEGPCFSHASAVPYVPVIALLRQICGVGETDSIESVTAAVHRTLQALGLAPESAPYLLQLLGLRDGMEQLAAQTPEAVKLRTLETLRRLIVQASRRRPVVIVVEDLHWTDKPSEEALASLVNELPGAPILFVSTYRPGYRAPWIERSFATQMALPPLSPEDSLAMMSSVLHREVPEPVARVILDKAEGNPFFLEEICRAVEGQADPGGLPAVPDTIEETLRARIDRLPVEPRSVLEVAAVLGREFPLRLLRRAWPAVGSLDAHLEVLTRLEFLYPRTRHEEAMYVFTHALTHEVAYVTMPAERRRELHVAAGRALESVFADRLEEAYDQLAYHYAHTEDAAKAVEYLSRFAEKAARGDHHQEAVQAWQEALRHVERLPAELRDRRQLEIVLRLPDSLLPLGRIDEICTLLLEERSRLERLQDAGLAARYHFLLARALWLGDPVVAVEHARRAIAESERCQDEVTMGGAYGILALAGALSGEAARGVGDGRRAVKLLEGTREQWSLAYAYWALGVCCSQIGAFADAIVAAQRALAIAETIGAQPLAASATWLIGIVHAAIGDCEQGIADCRRAVTLAQDVLYRAISTGFLGFAYLEKGDAAQAIAALERAIPLLQQLGLRSLAGWFTAFLAEAERLEGRLDRAEQCCAEALRLATEVTLPIAVGWARQSLGRIAAARGDLAAAAARFEEALAVFTAIHSRYACARTHMDLASLAWARVEPESARRHLEQAHRLFTELGVPRYRERVEHLAGDWGLRLTSAGGA